MPLLIETLRIIMIIYAQSLPVLPQVLAIGTRNGEQDT